MSITTHLPCKASSYQIFEKKQEINVTTAEKYKCYDNDEYSLIKSSNKDSKQWIKIREYCQWIIMDINIYYPCNYYNIYFDENKKDIEIMIFLLLDKLQELYEFKYDNKQILKVFAISVVSLVVKFIMDDYPDLMEMYNKQYPGIMNMEIYILMCIDFKLFNIWMKSQNIVTFYQ